MKSNYVLLKVDSDLTNILEYLATKDSVTVVDEDFNTVKPGDTVVIATSRSGSAKFSANRVVDKVDVYGRVNFSRKNTNPVLRDACVKVIPDAYRK